MSQTLTLNLPDETANWLATAARQTGRSIHEVSAAALEEARRVDSFAGIEFRTFNGERFACVKGHLQAGQVIAVAQEKALDAAETAAPFGWDLTRAQAALNYYKAFPQEIDSAIAANDALDETALQALLPNLPVVEVSFAADTEKQEE